jgi:hypothetical protein
MTRRSAHRGPPFQPDLLQGRPRSEVLAAFLADAVRWRLQYRCDDCCNLRADGSCLYAWPRQVMLAEPFEVVDARGEANFCRAFEPLGS